MSLQDDLHRIFGGNANVSSYTVKPQAVPVLNHLTHEWTPGAEAIYVDLAYTFLEAHEQWPAWAVGDTPGSARSVANNAFGLPNDVEGFGIKYGFGGVNRPEMLLDPKAEHRPLVGGVSYAHHAQGAGTFGGPIWGPNGTMYLVSNAHVHNAPDVSVGDGMVQPGIADGGSFPRVAGHFWHQALSVVTPNRVDIALALPDVEVDVRPEGVKYLFEDLVPHVPVVDVTADNIGLHVASCGRNQALPAFTVGQVVMIEAFWNVYFPNGVTYPFGPIYEVWGQGTDPSTGVSIMPPGGFGEAGRSGSRVWSYDKATNEITGVVGFIFAGSSSGKTAVIPASSVIQAIEETFGPGWSFIPTEVVEPPAPVPTPPPHEEPVRLGPASVNILSGVVPFHSAAILTGAFDNVVYHPGEEVAIEGRLTDVDGRPAANRAIEVYVEWVGPPGTANKHEGVAFTDEEGRYSYALWSVPEDVLANSVIRSIVTFDGDD